MNPQSLDLLCDPVTHAALKLDENSLLNLESGQKYPMRNGIPIFLNEATGANRKYQAMYDRLAPGYDMAERLYRFLSRKQDFRLEFIRELELVASAKVLEVSVGTGANLNYLPLDVEFFGLDLSWGMLRRCRRNVKRWDREAELFQGEAEQLPFRDAVFDCVFHVGAINFFNDKARAIEEMIRVAKPGTKIVIVDETEKVVTGAYALNPMTREYFKGEEKAAYCPIDLVPGSMTDLQSRLIANQKLYLMTFRKP